MNNFLSGLFGTKEENASAKNSVNDTANTLLNPQQQGNKVSYNPFLNRDGTLFNKMIDYKSVLNNPNISNNAKKYISEATGLQPESSQISGENYSEIQSKPVDTSDLSKLDMVTELPKLSSNQIKTIISKRFGKSSVITPSDSDGIYNAQQKTGISALAILGIGALESGYGTSNIAKRKNNIWGYGATNSNPLGNAKTFNQMADGALQFANQFRNTYYDKYGAKSIYSAGTGNNPARKGYAYNNDGSISSSWANQVGSIMNTFYNDIGGGYNQSTSNKTSNNSIVNTASKYLGTPYVWGGTTPKGFDCSGLTQYVMKENGVNINRTAAEQFKQGAAVSKENLQPGDLVFFEGYKKSKTNPGHVGIYIGNNQFLHAPSKNDKVKISNLSSRSDYVGARRY